MLCKRCRWCMFLSLEVLTSFRRTWQGITVTYTVVTHKTGSGAAVGMQKLELWWHMRRCGLPCCSPWCIHGMLMTVRGDADTWAKTIPPASKRPDVTVIGRKTCGNAAAKLTSIFSGLRIGWGLQVVKPTARGSHLCSLGDRKLGAQEF